VLAGLATSAVVAAFGLAGQSSTASGPPPALAGQLIGQLTVDGIGTLPVSSYSWGMTTAGSTAGGGGAGAGKVAVSAFNFLKIVDASSPALLTATATGKHIARAVFTAQWGSGGTAATAKYEFDDVIVESTQQSGAGGSAPTDSVSLNFARVKWSFTDGSGTTAGTWDVVQNAP